MADTLTKVVVDCSNSGAPDAAFVAQVEGEALELLRNGEADKAAAVMRDVQAALVLSSAAMSTVVPLAADELAQRELDQAAAVVAADAATAASWGALRAQRDAWLLATDWMFLDQLPTDTPAATLKAIAANKDAWTAFRQALRDLTNGINDPTDAGWPTPPDAPAISLSR